MARRRGEENGIAVVWAATDGRTIVADAWGKPFAVAVADVPSGVSPTLYSRLGDWSPGCACLWRCPQPPS